ncbi:endosomal/lysosomal proton channel TMEM175 isoform X6 [Callithrix jacchus]
MQTERARRRRPRDELPAVKRPAGLTQAEVRGAVAGAIPAQAPVTVGQQPHHVPAPGPRAGAGRAGGLLPWQEGRGHQGGDPVLPTHAQLQRRPAVHHRHCHDPACDTHGDLPGTAVRQKCTEASGNTDRRLPDDLSHRNGGLGGAHKVVPSCWENRRHTCPAQPGCFMAVMPSFPPGLHDDHHLPALYVFLNGDLPRCAPGHLHVLCVCDRHRDRAGTDCGVRIPLPAPAEPADPALRPQDPVQKTHPGHRPPRPSPLLHGSHLLPLLCPLGKILLCYLGWRAVVQSWLTAASTSRAQAILSPQPPESQGLQSYLLMATVILLPYISKAAGWCRDRLLGHREPLAYPVEVFTFDLHEPLSKERVEAFSDGVYAIVATLLILDIWGSAVVPQASPLPQHQSLPAAPPSSPSSPSPPSPPSPSHSPQPAIASTSFQRLLLHCLIC